MNYLGQFNFNDLKKRYTLNNPQNYNAEPNYNAEQNYNAEPNHQKKVIIVKNNPYYSHFNMFNFNSKSKGCGSCGKR